MNRTFKITHALKDVYDPIIHTVLKYAKTPQELYSAAQIF